MSTPAEETNPKDNSNNQVSKSPPEKQEIKEREANKNKEENTPTPNPDEDISVKQNEIKNKSSTPNTNQSNKILERFNDENNSSSINLQTPENFHVSKIDLDDENNHGFSHFYLLDNNDQENKKNDSIIKNKLKDEILNMLKLEINQNSFREKILKEEIEEIKNLYENQNNCNRSLDLNRFKNDLKNSIKNELEEEVKDKISFENNKFKKELLLIVKNEFDNFNDLYDNKLIDQENALQIHIRDEILSLLKNHFENKLNEEEKLIQTFKLKIAESEMLNKEKEEAEFLKLKDELLTSVAKMNNDNLSQENLIKSIEKNINDKINILLSTNENVSVEMESRIKKGLKEKFYSWENTIKDMNTQLNFFKIENSEINKKIDNLPYVRRDEINSVNEILMKKIDEKSQLAIENFEKKINEKNHIEEKKLKLEIVSIIKQQIETKIKEEEAVKKHEKDILYKNIEKDLSLIKQEITENVTNEMIKHVEEIFENKNEIFMKEKLEENKSVSVNLRSSLYSPKMESNNSRQTDNSKRDPRLGVNINLDLDRINRKKILLNYDLTDRKYQVQNENDKGFCHYCIIM